MDLTVLKFDELRMTALHILRLQVELNDGHVIRANRSVEELVELLHKAVASSSDPVSQALIRFITLLTDRQIVFFEVLGVNFSPLKSWAIKQLEQQGHHAALLRQHNR